MSASRTVIASTGQSVLSIGQIPENIPAVVSTFVTMSCPNPMRIMMTTPARIVSNPSCPFCPISTKLLALLKSAFRSAIMAIS